MSNLFLLTGEDSYQTLAKLKKWQAGFVQKYGDTNISILEEDFTAEKILQATDTMPFLSEKRLVIVKNFCQKAPAEEQKKLAEKLEKIPDFCVFFLVETTPPDKRTVLYKRFLKLGRVEDHFPIQGSELTRWITEKVQAQGGQIGFNEANYLAQTIGSDLWTIENEISKLINYCSPNPIDRPAIDLLTKANLSTSIFRFTDCLGQKNAALAIQTLQELLENGSEEIHYIFYMIIRQFRLILQIKSLAEKRLSPPEMARQLKQHPFVIKTTLNQIRNFDLSTLKKIYHQLLQIDIALKTGRIRISVDNTQEFNLALEKFILECCR